MPSKVLVADDSPTIRRRATSTLTEAGYDVACVEDGQAAWAALESGGPYGVLLCDILMPGIDGYELCRRVKTDARFAALPVLLLRGTFEPWDQNKAVEVGADGYVTKPFDAEALLSTLAEVLADGGQHAAPAPAPPAPLAEAPLALESPDLAEAEPLGETAPPAPEPLAELGFSPEPPAAEPAPMPMAAPLESAEAAPLDESPFGEPLGEPEAPPFGGDDVLGGSPLGLPDEPLGALGAPEPVAPAPVMPAVPPPAPVAAAAPAPAPMPAPAPFAAPAAPAAPLAAAPAPVAVAASALAIDDALIERIAERVAARLATRDLERVAWDVVPDVAEAVIRKRLADIEAQLGDA